MRDHVFDGLPAATNYKSYQHLHRGSLRAINIVIGGSHNYQKLAPFTIQLALLLVDVSSALVRPHHSVRFQLPCDSRLFGGSISYLFDCDFFKLRKTISL